MEDRRKRGLCYSCDAKWTRDHVYEVPKLFLIEAVQKEEEGDDTQAVPTEDHPGEFFLDTEPEDHEDRRLYSVPPGCCPY
jgi:hypothetical protein